MVMTKSCMVELGSKMPSFELLDVVSHEHWSVQKHASGSAGYGVMFICNHCPFVKHIQQGLVNLSKDYLKQDIVFLAISANDASQYPEDGPDRMRDVAAKWHYPFPYLYDETQQTARAFHATCTPDFFIYDGSRSLIYRGQLDDSRPGNGLPVTGESVRLALDGLLSGQPPLEEQRASIGCNIKWKVI